MFGMDGKHATFGNFGKCGLPAFGGSVACDGFFVGAWVPGLVIGLVVGVIGVLGEL